MEYKKTFEKKFRAKIKILKFRIENAFFGNFGLEIEKTIVKFV